MDKVKRYRILIKEELEVYSKRRPANMPGVSYELTFDEQRDQYMLFALGWQGEEYIHKWVFHLQIKDQVIWVHEDSTDVGIALKLVNRGVPREDIVLGYIPEYERNLPASKFLTLNNLLTHANYRARMSDQKEGSKTNTLQFKISLPGSKPLIWRRFQVTDDFRFDRFHQVLIIIMGWKNYHLHEFRIKGREIGMPDDDYRYEFPNLEDESGVFLRELDLQKGDEFLYIYDFGDHWEHSLKVEKLVRGASSDPLCLDGKNACPPEDCGGIYGYQDMKKVLKKPLHPEYESYIQWLPEGFDPAFFNINSINAELAKFTRWHQRHPRAKSTPWHQLR